MAGKDHWVIDVPKTYPGGVIFIACEAKMTRVDRDNPKSEVVQGRDKDGKMKWQVMLVVDYEQFGQTKHETMYVTITQNEKPCQGIQPGQKVVIENLILGVMPTKGGVSDFYSATAIKPVNTVNPTPPLRQYGN
jgi:hypothetical protein